MTKQGIEARTFFLNEKHEFTRGEKKGGGRVPNYAPIDWVSKSATLRNSIEKTRAAVTSSKDPLRDRRFFVLAAPESTVAKESSAKNKPSTYDQEPRYSGKHSRVFRRLGIDLLHVTDSGSAIVHATPDRIEQLVRTASQLPQAGVREQARWATIKAFSPIPESLRLDPGWLAGIPAREQVDVIVELQPLLTSLEANEVMHAVLGLLDRGADERLVGAGTDFSGRHWYRGRAGKKSLNAIAKHLFSVEAVHPPILTELAATTRRAARRIAEIPAAAPPTPAQASSLPSVAVVDCGVPQGHAELGPYSRGQYLDPNSQGVLGDHGSSVAARVVFGHLDFANGLQARPPGLCRFLDVVVSEDAEHVNTKSILTAMEAVVGAYPDVRVFNLSFGSYSPLGSLGAVERREVLIALRDLDNFIFARDVIVVVAAGNTRAGVQPATAYPGHFADISWALGSWTMGFNTLTCGGTVGHASPTGLAKTVDWPSPFSRVGPGIADAPVPDFAAFAGDCTPQYQWAATLGVWVCRADGTWEDRPGTSYAAPLLAREAALALQHLQGVCVPDGRPFAATVKAFLALTARMPALPTRLRPLAEKTIGRGYASASRLGSPDPASAVLLWQGVLDHNKDIARVQIPIPRDWLQKAQKASLRLVWAWDSPVHDAALDVWACRRVHAVLKPQPSGAAVHGSRGAHASYPLVDRTFDLSSERLAEKKIVPTDDAWLVELWYEDTAEYSPGIEFSPQQRVAFAAELFDAAETPTSPQAAIQKLPAAATMIELGAPRARIASPVVIKVRR